MRRILVDWARSRQAIKRGGEGKPLQLNKALVVSEPPGADGMTLLALQNQILTTIQVVTPGKESEPRTLSAGNQNHGSRGGLAWAPDGKLVYASDRESISALWEMSADGSSPQRLNSQSFRPAVPLRGGFIAFMRYDRNNQASIWRMDRDGGNPKQLTRGTWDSSPSISPDGQWVVFSSSSQGSKWVLMKVASEGGATAQLTDYGADYPSVSPDGKWVACLHLPGAAGDPFYFGHYILVRLVPRWPPGPLPRYRYYRRGVGQKFPMSGEDIPT